MTASAVRAGGTVEKSRTVLKLPMGRLSVQLQHPAPHVTVTQLGPGWGQRSTRICSHRAP